MKLAMIHRLATPTRTAAAWILGAVLWAIAGVAHGGVDEPIWIVADIILLAALLGLWSLRLEHSTIGTIGFSVATLGRIVFIAAELLAAVQGNDDNALLPIAALLTVIGMLLVGIATIRARIGHGIGRYAPLAVGLYPLIIMFPYVAAHDGHASNAAITGWALTMLGVAATATAHRVNETTPTAAHQTA